MWMTHAEMERCGVRFVLNTLEPKSPYGRERLKKLRPFPPEELPVCQREVDNLERTLAAAAPHERDFLRLGEWFAQMKDIRQSLSRCVKGAVLDEVELFELKRFLLQLREVAPLFETINHTAAYDALCLTAEPEALEVLDIDGSGVASFTVSGRYSEKLTQIRAEKHVLEQLLREAGDDEARQTLTLRRTELVAAEQAEEQQVRACLSRRLAPHAPALLANTDAIGTLDMLMQKAALARRHTAAKPILGGDALAFSGMTNPMVAERLLENGQVFTPLDIRLEKGATVITGANMGGKSVALKTLALNSWLAQCGFYVFANEARCPLFGSLWLVSDDLEDTARGLSSFGGEMTRLDELLKKPEGDFALVLLDEFARGTNPEEGAAIARAVTEHLNRRFDIAVLTTHYEGVATHARAHYQVAGLAREGLDTLAPTLRLRPPNERVAAIAQLMDYRLLPVQPGAPLPHDALAICRLLGISDDIIGEIMTKLLTINKNKVE